jgi:ubiquinone/menaquinone biosynthesis C-methylase UbiE
VHRIDERTGSKSPILGRKSSRKSYWYVSSAGPYEGRNLAEFWASGPKIWNDLKSASGYLPTPSDTVVEIGCGVGRLTRAIAPEVGKVLAFDLSAEMLTIARSSVEAANASFHRAETPALAEIADSSANAFVAYCVFQHLPDLDVLQEYLKTAARVLKPGGLLIFTMTPRTWRDSIAFALRMRRWMVSAARRKARAASIATNGTGFVPQFRRSKVYRPSKQKISCCTETSCCSSARGELAISPVQI